MIYRCTLFVLAAALSSVGLVAHAGGFYYPDFGNTTGLQLNGDATTIGGALRLIPTVNWKRGSAFYTIQQDITSFTTTFRFKITEPDAAWGGGDGFVFTIQPGSASALGNNGLGMGYGGLSPSVAVEFDMYPNGSPFDPSYDSGQGYDGDHIGVNINGSVVSTVTTLLPPNKDFEDGAVWSATVNYDGTTLTATATSLADSSATATVSAVLDIPTILGSSTSYVGFTAGSGDAGANHDLLSWQYNSAAVPEPSTLAVTGLAAVLFLVRTRQRRRRQERRR